MASMDIDFTRRNKKPRLLSDSEREKLDEFVESIHYSSRYAQPTKQSGFNARTLLSASRIVLAHAHVPAAFLC
jgi:DNA replicative helicase MCM subunit Mcm2 (Cdc46/Mcm family)